MKSLTAIAFCCTALTLFSTVAGKNLRFEAQSNAEEQQQPRHARLAADGLALDINTKTGDYVLSIKGSPWLRSAPLFLTAGGKEYNSTTAGGLMMVGSTMMVGMDEFGNFNLTVLSYKARNGVSFEAHFKVYAELVLFGQVFPDGVTGSSVGDIEKISSGFPSFVVSDMPVSPAPLGYLSYGGLMFGDTSKHVGIWNTTNADKKITSGLDSGPLVLFNTFGDTIVFSSFTQHMSTSLDMRYRASMMTLAWGVMGGVDSIPKGYNLWTMASYSPNGVNWAMEKWGEELRLHYGRTTEYRDTDLTNNYIGYYTDNGAYYYYVTEPGEDYETTMINARAYASKMNIPFRYLQYDSWFYPRYEGKGVIEWADNKTVFPHGLQYLWDKTGLISAAHNGYWSNTTVYAKQNGGKYNFIVEVHNKKSLPTDEMFWLDLFSNSSKWGLMLYEQDWMNVQFDQMDATTSSLTLGHDWLIQMGRAAQANRINIQYCMTTSRQALNALQIPNVVQARASGDYQPGNGAWKIGISSMFAHAMGVAPFKDTFWTTTTQPGNKYDLSEPYPELQSVAATLSTGPVGPSDRIGHADRDLIMRSCNDDGLILKPSKPATAVDGQLYHAAFNDFKGEVSSTFSFISGHLFGYIFAADFGSSDKFIIGPAAAGFGHMFPGSMIFSWSSPKMLSQFSEANPLVLAGCTKKLFCLYQSSPTIHVGTNVVVLAGELDKWVPMSPKRVTKIQVEDIQAAELYVSLTGAPNEKVLFSYTLNGNFITVPCLLSSAGSASIGVVKQQCNGM